ncbi:MAG: aspartate aminotransferase family protein, partial [Thermodesulfobacteriota bacterium]
EMHMKGWYIQPSFSFENVPANIHLSINLSNVGKTDIFIADLKESVEKAKALPSGQLLAAVNEMIEKQGESILENAGSLLELAGVEKGRLPDRIAPVNEVLDALPPEWREKILLDVTNDFFRP